PPLQPAKMYPVHGAAVRVMAVPAGRASVQSLPQLMPGPVTVPYPVPPLLMLTVTVGVVAVNVAVTVVLTVGDSVHAARPEQPPPLQPASLDPLAGAAVRVVAVPAGRASVQSLPQLMPDPVTVPVPVPPLLTVSVTVGVAVVVALNVALTVVLTVGDRVH